MRACFKGEKRGKREGGLRKFDWERKCSEMKKENEKKEER